MPIFVIHSVSHLVMSHDILLSFMPATTGDFSVLIRWVIIAPLPRHHVSGENGNEMFRRAFNADDREDY